MPKNKLPLSEYLTKELADEICAKSANGESVVLVIREKGLPELETLNWLRDNYYKEVVQAKRIYQKKVKDDNSAPTNNP